MAETLCPQRKAERELITPKQVQALPSSPYEVGYAAGLRNGSVYDNPWFKQECNEGRHWVDGLIAGWRDGAHVKPSSDIPRGVE